MGGGWGGWLELGLGLAWQKLRYVLQEREINIFKQVLISSKIQQLFNKLETWVTCTYIQLYLVIFGYL